MGFDERMAARAEQPLETAVGSFDASSKLRLWRAWLEREAFPVVIAALYGGVLLLVLPGELVQDSWSTLVSGREIVGHGLPQHEALTVMAHGARWIDQQWLAQLTFYELFRAGGYRLILLVHALLVFSAFALALVAARRRGGSPIAVFGVGALCFFVAPWAWQLRAQSFAPLLFVAVLWLLIEDSRRPSRRVLAVLPLLALWANLHGSVVLGATLVAIYGVGLLLRRRAGPADRCRSRRARAACGPVLAVRRLAGRLLPPPARRPALRATRERVDGPDPERDHGALLRTRLRDGLGLRQARLGASRPSSDWPCSSRSHPPCTPRATSSGSG